jgi:MOSC domain-containing protein YiiM
VSKVPNRAVVAVSASSGRGVRKSPADSIRVVEGLGVEGDIHAGPLVRHASRMRRDPNLPNLRQVHLLGEELHRELAAQGLPVSAGDMGENILTSGIDLLALPQGAVLRIGDTAMLRVTGLRNPCKALDELHTGLMNATLSRGPDGAVIRKAGVMSVVLADGVIRPGDAIVVELPHSPHLPLLPV